MSIIIIIITIMSIVTFEWPLWTAPLAWLFWLRNCRRGSHWWHYIGPNSVQKQYNTLKQNSPYIGPNSIQKQYSIQNSYYIGPNSVQKQYSTLKQNSLMALYWTQFKNSTIQYDGTILDPIRYKNNTLKQNSLALMSPYIGPKLQCIHRCRKIHFWQLILDPMQNKTQQYIASKLTLAKIAWGTFSSQPNAENCSAVCKVRDFCIALWFPHTHVYVTSPELNSVFPSDYFVGSVQQ